ncbi:MAG: Ppx/GppA family phosphatase, partial [Alphaproteobacteria bacterium]|nr:Ppx/GppA family phosphatase [Alphaproteobacteria bacterium]
MTDPTSAPGSAAPGGRVGVIDIGSNSIRLVVFDGLKRAPLALFNEKVLCGLGRGLERSRRLNPEGTIQGLENLRRFVHLARLMDVVQLDVLATAAVRDAIDGPTFVAQVERQCGTPVRVISGGEEALLSADGVLCGIPDADGVMGDLGGGSVELVSVEGGRTGEAVTLPLGPLRLADATGDNPKKARAIVEKAVGSVDWLARRRGRDLYLVGGAWRAVARIHMERTSYPLHVIHQYAIARPQAEYFLRWIAGQGRKALEKMTGVSRRRLEAVPYATVVLGRLIQDMMPERVVFSAYGLREGHLFSQLDPALRRRDPLIEACRDVAARGSRFTLDGDRLFDWTAGLFADDVPGRRRLRHAAALLSDTAWNEHPDYRAEQAFHGALRLPYGGIDHRGRVILGTALHARYGGDPDAPAILPYGPLAAAVDLVWARAVGV